MPKRLFILFATILITGASAWATIVVRMDFNRQALEADLVIVGKPVSSEPVRWRGYPCTKVKIRIEEVIAGATSGGEVEVIQPGGARVRVAGVKKLLSNKSYLLLLEKLPDGYYRIMGFNQGAHRIFIEKGTSRKVVITETRRVKGRGITLEAAKKRIRAVRQRARKKAPPK